MVGLGYIGLPTAAVLATQGVRVHGVDTNATTVAAVQAGDVPFAEPDLSVAVAGAVARGVLTASTKPTEADAHVIAVPTPTLPDHAADLTFIEKAAEGIAECLRGGEVIVLESTSPPGTTERLSKYLKHLRADLVFPHERGQEPDVAIAYCPERVLPGSIMVEITTNDRVIGGVTAECGRRAAGLYQVITRAHLYLTSARTAEMVKLAENAYRDVNLAFANELSVVCDELEVDAWDVIDLANKHPRVGILRPGPGVGGHCIAVDPWFIIAAAPGSSHLMRVARQVNDDKPHWVLRKIEKALQLHPGGTVACLGLTFKADVDDLRGSPALQIVEGLVDSAVADVLVVEPRLDALPSSLLHPAAGRAARLCDLDSGLRGADIVVLLVDHKQFQALDPARLEDKVVIDTRGLFRKSRT